MNIIAKILSFFLLFISLDAQDIIDSYINLENPTNSLIYDHWTTDNGLPQNSINSIAQTSDGYMWFATFNGLLRFDGKSFKIYSSANTEFLHSERIINLFADKKDRLWIVTESNSILVLENGIVIDFTKKYDINSRFLYAIREAGDGSILISAYNKIFRYKDDVMSEINFERFNIEGPTLTIFADSDSSTYYCFADITIKEKDGNLEQVNFIGKVGGYSMYRDSKNRLWFAGEGGLYELKDNQLIPYEALNRKLKKDVKSVSEDRNGNLWIGTYSEGIYFVNDRGLYKFTDPEFSFAEIVNIFRDREDNMWVGTKTRGMLKFRDKAIYFLEGAADFRSNSICPILELGKGEIYIGGSCSGITRLIDGEISYLGNEQGLDNTCVWSLMETSDQNLYVGTYGSGLYYYDKYRDRFYNLKQVRDYVIFTMLEDRNKNVWFGGIQGVHVKRGEEIFTYDEKDGLAGAEIKAIYEASDGTIWLASVGGITKWDGKRFTSFTVADGLSNDNVRSIYEDSYGRIWFGTYGGGINIYNGKTFRVLDEDRGLYDNIVSAMIEDDFGRIWLTSNTGLSSVLKEEVNEFIEGNISSVSSVSYLKGDGLVSTEFNGGFTPSGLKASDGTLWLPTINGITIVKPDKMKKNSAEARILIEEIRVDSLIVENPVEIIVEPEFDKIEITYTSLSFRSPHNIKFRTKLEGLDEDWSGETSSRTIYYNYLPSGTYTFKVMGTNSDGIWSEEVKSFTLIIEAKFYETILFYVLLFIFILSVVSIFYYYRIVSLGKRAILLQQMVDSKTIDLNAEKEKLEKLLVEVEGAKSKIEEQNEELAELNAAKDTFFSVISHDLKNPFNSLLGYTELLLSGYEEMSQEEIMEFISDIKQTSASTYSLLENLLQWANSQTGNLKLDIEPCNLYELTKEAILVNSASAKRKKIAINFVTKNVNALCDENTISTVVRNLISNAIKFTHEHGFIDVMLDSDDKQSYIVVRDTGVGMNSEKVKRIFALDSRKSTQGTNSETGTGLGLIICREFVERNSGNISVTSVPGKGTEFIISLPKSD